MFIEDRGQGDDETTYSVRGKDKILYFNKQGITIELKDSDGKKETARAAKLQFVGSEPTVSLRGEHKLKTKVSYFTGKRENWKTGIPTFSRLVYENLWPGIDLVYSGTVNRLKYEFLVKPGADPDRIRMAYQGVSRLTVKKTGELEVTTPSGSFEDGKPYAYQRIEGEQREVSMAYRLDQDKTFTYGFDLGSYDPDQTLILDPVFLVYCGYIGGFDLDSGADIALDDDGNTYIIGTTSSWEPSFPVTVGPDLTHNGSNDVYVAKIRAADTRFEYIGFIGGLEDDSSSGITVDGEGNVYVTGTTESTEASFPVKVGPDLTYNATVHNGHDGFVAKVNASGTDLVYCGYIGGTDRDSALGIAVDSTGCAYVVGQVLSSHSSFPVTSGPDLTYGGGLFHGDAFVAKVNALGTDLDYCGYVGGDADDLGTGIAVDDSGQAYITGRTASDETSFPVHTGPCLTHSNTDWGDAFVAKVNAQGTELVYSGYIGGDDDEWGLAIALDKDANAYVTGRTFSTQSTFPVEKGPDLTYAGGYYYGDAFVAKVNDQGTDLDYCGYIGGFGDENPSGITVDYEGNAYVVGSTTSFESSFPVKKGPGLYHYPTGYMGEDGFVARVDPQGSALDYCGYIGGDLDDSASSIAVDNHGNAFIVGTTSSKEITFPVTGDWPDQTFNGNPYDAFVCKVFYQSLAAEPGTLSAGTGGIVDFTLDAGTGHAGRSYFILGSVSGIEPGLPLPGGMVTLPLVWDSFTELVIPLAGSAALPNFQGVLDAAGEGAAQLNSLGPLPPAAVGVPLLFAYLLYYPVVFFPYDFVSNPVNILVVP